MENSELKNIAPNLSNIKKGNSFSVPDNYFDEFPSKIQSKISEKENPPYFKRFLQVLKPNLSLAASITIFALIAVIAVKSFVKDPIYNNNIADNSEVGDIEMFDIDDNTIIDIIVEEIETDNDDEIFDDEMLDYLAYNTDYNTIIDEY